MLHTRFYASVCLLVICSIVSVSAQQAAPAAANAVVPPVIKFSGVLTDVNNKPLTGTVGVTFSLYKESQGGAALWVETQNVTPDKTGHYTVMLGSTTSQGLPPAYLQRVKLDGWACKHKAKPNRRARCCSAFPMP